MPSSSRPSERFWSSYKYWLPPAVISLLLTIIYLNPFIGDWDGLDYTIFSLHGRPSSMALGRSLFTLFNFGLFKFAHALFGVRPDQAYLLFKFAVVVQTPLAVIACWLLARDLSGSRRAATIAALLIATSPMLVIYGGQVMTDVPSILLTALALTVHLRGVKQRSLWLMLVGAALLGLGVNLRETVGFYAPWLIVAPLISNYRFSARTVGIIAASLAIFVAVAVGPWAIWFAASPLYRSDWYIWLYSTQREEARHPIGLANLKPFFVYFILASPLIVLSLPFAIWKEWRTRGVTLMLTAAITGLIATALLFFNYSTTINWRYFLTGLPALAPIAGDYFLRIQTKRFGSEGRALASAIVCVAIIAVVMGTLIQPRSNDYLNRLALAKDYNQQLKLIPKDAVVIAGAQTVAVTYWRGIGEGNWETIGVGAGFPQGLLQSKIEEHLQAGRRVFLDVDTRWWLPCSWRVSEIQELAAIESHFHFKRIAPTIYEIRPAQDQSATDKPELKKLLPENRPEEVKHCFDSG